MGHDFDDRTQAVKLAILRCDDDGKGAPVDGVVDVLEAADIDADPQDLIDYAVGTEEVWRTESDRLYIRDLAGRHSR